MIKKSVPCPYCKKEINIKNDFNNKEQEIKCDLCSKKFKIITGKIITIRGNPNPTVYYGDEPISITLKMNNKNKTFNFKFHFGFLITEGDIISFVYKKEFDYIYEEEPSYIFNWTTSDSFKLKIILDKDVFLNPAVILIGFLFGSLGGFFFAIIVEILIGIQNYGIIFYLLWIIGSCLIYYIIAIIGSYSI